MYILYWPRITSVIFNQHHYLQFHGTAKGTKMAPSFANCSSSAFSELMSFFPFHPHTCWRYLDDIFMIWTERLDHLKIFVDYLNIHPTIKFTSNHSLPISPSPTTWCLYITAIWNYPTSGLLQILHFNKLLYNRGPRIAKFASFSFVLFPNKYFFSLHLLTLLFPFLSD